MNDTDITTPAVPQSTPEVTNSVPTNPQTPAAIPVAGTPQKYSITKYLPIIGVVLLLAILVVTALYIWSLRSTPVTQAPEPTPIPAATPTPMRVLSKVATTSAFAIFENSVASLSATLNAFNFQDGTLTPPVLELDLGLTP